MLLFRDLDLPSDGSGPNNLSGHGAFTASEYGKARSMGSGSKRTQ